MIKMFSIMFSMDGFKHEIKGSSPLIHPNFILNESLYIDKCFVYRLAVWL